MDGYGQFCPVSKAAEVVCQRWTPLILRELLVGSTRFNEIRRGVPTCSTALLSKRLKELERAGVVERVVGDRRTGPATSRPGSVGDHPDAATDHPGPGGRHPVSGATPAGNSSSGRVAYRLTEAGKELLPIVLALGEWGQRWVRTDYRDEELDPGLLLWDVRRNLDPGGLGPKLVTIRFVFPSADRQRRVYWLVADGRDVDLCVADPGREVDATVEADLRTLTAIWMGETGFAEALADGRIVLSGPSRLTRKIPGWVGRHPHFAAVAPAAAPTEPVPAT